MFSWGAAALPWRMMVLTELQSLLLLLLAHQVSNDLCSRILSFCSDAIFGGFVYVP